MNPKQKEFLNTYIKRSYSDLWHEQLVKLKGLGVNKNEESQKITEALTRWELVEIRVGEGNTRPYRCQCGRKLKYQYVIEDTYMDITYCLGVECAKRFTGIDGKLLKRVCIEEGSIHGLQDEIVEKLQSGEHLRQCYLLDFSIDDVYRKQLEVGLPLADRQLKKVHRAIEGKEIAGIQRIHKAMKNLSIEDVGTINEMSQEERCTLLVRLRDGSLITSIEELMTIDYSYIAKREEKGKRDMVATQRKEKEMQKARMHGEGVDVINSAESQMNEKQLNFWKGKMSLLQRMEVAPLFHCNKKPIYRGTPTSVPSLIQEQMDLGIPLTRRQMKKVGLERQERT